MAFELKLGALLKSATKLTKNCHFQKLYNLFFFCHVEPTHQNKQKCTVKPLFSRESIFRGRPPYKFPRGPMFAVGEFFLLIHTIW